MWMDGRVLRVLFLELKLPGRRLMASQIGLWGQGFAVRPILCRDNGRRSDGGTHGLRIAHAEFLKSWLNRFSGRGARNRWLAEEGKNALYFMLVILDFGVRAMKVNLLEEAADACRVRSVAFRGASKSAAPLAHYQY